MPAEVLDTDRSSYKSSNDETTPIDCVSEMISKIPEELWDRKDLKILDPCCGNGNFLVPIYYKVKNPEKSLYFNDINQERLEKVKRVFSDKANITDKDYLSDFSTVIIQIIYIYIYKDIKSLFFNLNNTCIIILCQRLKILHVM